MSSLSRNWCIGLLFWEFCREDIETFEMSSFQMLGMRGPTFSCDVSSDLYAFEIDFGKKKTFRFYLLFIA